MKTVLITGGTKGIGRAIALTLSGERFNVVVNYSSDDIEANETLKECLQVNSNVILIKCDVSDYASVEKMFQLIKTTFGSIDIVINNAGINIDKPVLSMTEWDWDSVVNVNMKGVFLVAKTAAEYMLKQGYQGQIVNIASTTGIGGRKNGINYCASKAGVIVMTKCLAMELGPTIRVNCVIPGITRTKEIEERFQLKTNEAAEIEKRKIPLERLGDPSDVANLIKFLISEQASYINGQKIIIDGGEYMS